MIEAPTKGWTESEARATAARERMREQNARSEFSTSAAFDPLWSEWVIVTSHPTSPVTMHRKGRRGLLRAMTWRVIEPEGAL